MRKRNIKRKKDSSRRLAFVFLLIFVIVVLVSLRVFNINLFSKGNESVKIYFYEEDSKELVWERHTIPKFSHIEEKIKRICLEIVRGPKNSSLSRVVDPNTKIIGVETKEDIAIVSFSEEIKNRILPGISGEAASLYSIVNSIVANTPLRRVQILINDKPDNFYWDSVSISEPLNMLTSSLPQGRKAIIYFFDKNATFPILYETEIPEPEDRIRWARIVFDKLKSGPSGIYKDYLIPTVPKIANLKDIRIEGDVLTLDFTSDILSYTGFGSASENAFMYSIILSMTEIPGINKVLFLVDGEVQDTIGGNFDTSKPLTRWYFDLNPPPEGMIGYPIYYIYKIKDKYFITPITKFTKEEVDGVNTIFNGLKNPPVGLETFIPKSAKIVSHSLKGDTLKIDIKIDLSFIDSKTKERLFLKELVYTFTDALNIDKLDISINGKKPNLPFGTNIENPISRAEV